MKSPNVKGNIILGFREDKGFLSTEVGTERETLRERRPEDYKWRVVRTRVKSRKPEL